LAKDNLLKVEDISVSYKSAEALRHVSLEVNEGEIVSIIGANGAGKSTLLKTLIGINRVSSGHIYFMGDDITHKATDRIVASGISLIPEGRGILSNMTVMENLQLGIPRGASEVDQRFQVVFSLFPILRERLKQKAGLLSGGQQQMLSIGRGFMSSPKLMMLDEPSLGLSPIMVEELFETILELNKGGQTVLLSEQNAHKALQCAQRGYVFETGVVSLSGNAQELLADDGVRQAYLGV